MSNPVPDALSQAQAIVRDKRDRVQQRMLLGSGLAQGTSQQIQGAIRACLDGLGFIVLGLSPSFEDWKQSPQDRKQMVAFYIVAIGLIYYGVFSN